MTADRDTFAPRLVVLLACFSGRRVAGQVRSEILQRLETDGRLVDDVLLEVDAKHRARVHDPRRVAAGTLTPALTWGLFGLVAGGDVRGLVIWAVLGAICGAIYAYTSEHILAKNELANIGNQLEPNSSAIIAFVEGSDEHELVASAPELATVASAVAIEADLTAHTDAAVAPSGAAAVSMTLLRYDGEHTARKATAAIPTSDAHVELIVEVPSTGRARVVSPTAGVGAMSKSDVISWGGFGLVFGAIVGFAGDGGLFGALEQGVATGVGCAVFGLAAGALYGLWAGRGTSSRRIKGLRPLLPPNTSTAVVWVSGAWTDAIAKQVQAASQHVTLCFHATEHGAVLATS
jgi:uncharacterized membrane protein